MVIYDIIYMHYFLIFTFFGVTMLLDQTKIEKCWIDTLNLLKDLIDEESFKNYIEPIKFEIIGDSIVLTTQNDIFKNIINNNYINAIRESLQKKIGFPIDVILKS